MMYLCKEIIGTDGNAYPMAGVLPQSATMENMKLRLGYRTLCYKNDVLRGHEFHYSRIVPMESPLPSVAKAFTAKGGQTDTPLYRYKNVLAGYTHLYWGDVGTIGLLIFCMGKPQIVLDKHFQYIDGDLVASSFGYN